MVCPLNVMYHQVSDRLVCSYLAVARVQAKMLRITGKNIKLVERRVR
jgi:hypothetical protein